MNQKKKKKGLFHKKKPVKKAKTAGMGKPSQQNPEGQAPRRRPVLFDQDAPAGKRPQQDHKRQMKEIYWTPPKAAEEEQPSRTEPEQQSPQKAGEKPEVSPKKTVKKKKKSLLAALWKQKKSSSKPRASLEDIKRDARQSAEQADQQEELREQKKQETGKRSLHRRRRMSAFYYVMLVLFVLGVGITLCLTVFFRIETVAVEGKGRYSVQQIRDAAGIKEGDNLLMIDADEAAQRVESLLPYAENVKIEKRMPSVVTISYEEATDAVAIGNRDQLIILSAHYKVLRFADELPDGAVWVKGIHIGECEQGGQAVFEDGQEEELLKEVADCIRDTGFTGLTEFDFSEPANLRARFEDRVTIVFGTQQDLKAKLKLAQSVLDEKIGPNEKGTLTVSAVPRANFLPDYSTEDSEGTETSKEDVSEATDASKEELSASEDAA